MGLFLGVEVNRNDQAVQSEDLKHNEIINTPPTFIFNVIGDAV